MSTVYSPAFQALVREGGEFGKLIVECGAGGGDLRSWENRREFMADAFSMPGTVLDSGTLHASGAGTQPPSHGEYV